MLITDLREIGGRMHTIRKSRGLTQAQVAEAADLSDRSYADIERGGTNMRLETLLKICGALHVTPDALLIDAERDPGLPEDLLTELNTLPDGNKTTALKILSVYLQSLKK